MEDTLETIVKSIPIDQTINIEKPKIISNGIPSTVNNAEKTQSIINEVRNYVI